MLFRQLITALVSTNSLEVVKHDQKANCLFLSNFSLINVNYKILSLNLLAICLQSINTRLGFYIQDLEFKNKENLPSFQNSLLILIEHNKDKDPKTKINSSLMSGIILIEMLIIIKF